MVSMCVLCCFLCIEHRYWMFYICVGSAQLDVWARQVKLPFFCCFNVGIRFNRDR